MYRHTSAGFSSGTGSGVCKVPKLETRLQRCIAEFVTGSVAMGSGAGSFGASSTASETLACSFGAFEVG